MAYNPSANDLAEAFNKTIIKILTKLTSNSKRDWNEKLGESLWVYHTTVHTPTGTTPYSLVYGYEAVLPLEIHIPSLRITLTVGMTPEDSHQQHLAKLEALYEKRLEAQQHIKFYQARITKAFDKKVKYRSFKEGELVIAIRRPMILNSKKKGKFQPKWEGPLMIETIYLNGAYRLVKPNGDKFMMPINGWIEAHIGDVTSHTWKDLMKQAEIAEKSFEHFNKLEPHANFKGNKDKQEQTSQSKAKETFTVEVQNPSN
ncbi:uncharacterized protein LOC109841571 [Asparagus officinalis]|uniref:uncharacterized protein LOC109841571 n=1 Tax=Asparagus officinalis TaxID=4686 RepID=UPI00098E0334|nr:uncharacterized protein LOC109841571 [Asparagus officinalis]